MAVRECLTIDLPEHINSFEVRMRDQLREAQVPNLSGLHDEVATLRLEVCTLVKSHIPTVPLVIPLYIKPLSIPTVAYM